MSEVVLLPSNTSPFGWKSTRLDEWKRYLRTFKPINELLIATEQLDRWQVEKAEKDLKQKLRRQ